ncbi:hypothetical protein [Fundidesulfovibrio agrisoli]|uniref:hypothetical protein n=1 Tax=Fundidesulfovibrio agrisoli TaxID=2922717 RepID=UPI001FABA623|nr:hypothetical protein [Fundidesulfovibrio agrisoli]
MATISGGLSQTSFVQSFANSPALVALSGGLIPSGSNVTLSSLGPVGQLYVGQTYGLYASLGGTAPGGLTGANLQTFQAFSQFYALIDIMLFGPLIGLGGTTIR